MLDNATPATLANCARINSAWYDLSVKRLYAHYHLLPTIKGRTPGANLTERKLSHLKRTRHLTAWTHDARLCHSETAPPLPSLEVLSFHSDKIHNGERPFGRRPCPLLRDLNPSTVILHGPDFPVSVTEIWGLLGGRDVIVSYDPTKAIAHFHVIDRWRTIINPEGAPRSITVVFCPKQDGYIPEEALRYTNLRRLSSWVGMLPSEVPVTIVDVGAGATQEGLVTSIAEVAWPLAPSWEEGGKKGFVQCLKDMFIKDVKESVEAEAAVEGGPGIGEEGGEIDVEARLASIRFLELEQFMVTPIAGDVFAD